MLRRILLCTLIYSTSIFAGTAPVQGPLKERAALIATFAKKPDSTIDYLTHAFSDNQRAALAQSLMLELKKNELSSAQQKLYRDLIARLQPPSKIAKLLKSSLPNFLLGKALSAATITSGLVAAGGLLPYLSTGDSTSPGAKTIRAAFWANSALLLALATAANAVDKK